MALGSPVNTTKFVNRYQALLDETMRELDAELKKIIANSASLAAQERAQIIIAQRIQIENFLTGQTTENLNLATNGAYKKIFGLSEEQFKAAGVSAPFKSTDLDIFQSLKNSDYAKIRTAAIFDANTIWDDLFRWSITGSEASLQNIRDVLEKGQLQRYSETHINTHIDGFSRTVNGVRSANAGITRYRYDGPTPEREFCHGIYGKIYTLEEISGMDNGQIGDVFFYGGGYNCRHYWTPIP